MYLLYVTETMHSGGVLIPGVVLYTSLCSWDHAGNLTKGSVIISGVSFHVEGFH